MGSSPSIEIDVKRRPSEKTISIPYEKCSADGGAMLFLSLRLGLKLCRGLELELEQNGIELPRILDQVQNQG